MVKKIVEYLLILRFLIPHMKQFCSVRYFSKTNAFWPIFAILRYFQVCFILARMMLIVFALLNIIWICVLWYPSWKKSVSYLFWQKYVIFFGQFWSLYGIFIYIFFCKNDVNCICIVKYHLNLRFFIPIMKEVCEFPDLAKNCLIWPILVTFRYLMALFGLKNCKYFPGMLNIF